MKFEQITTLVFTTIMLILMNFYEELKTFWIIGFIPAFAFSQHLYSLAIFWKIEKDTKMERFIATILFTSMSWIMLSLYLFMILENKIKYGTISSKRFSTKESALKKFEIIKIEINYFKEGLSESQKDLIILFNFIESKIEDLKKQENGEYIIDYLEELSKEKNKISELILKN